MIGPGTGVRVYLACGVTDMRKGISGLAMLAQTVLRQKPASGAVFVARQSGSESSSFRIRIRDRVVAMVFLMIDAGKRYV